jgi:hypothetical protein
VQDNPPSFGFTVSNISARVKTTNAVTWTPPEWLVVGESSATQRTPDLRLVVQEVISRPGWSSGNAMVFILNGAGRRVADSFDKVGGRPPRLHVAWGTTPVPASWITAYFPDANRPGASLKADPDGDGLNNLAEYVIGSDPTNAASGFRLEAEQLPRGQLVLFYPMQPTSGPDYAGLRRVYDLQTGTGLSRGIWVGVPRETSIPAISGSRRYTNEAIDSIRYYRVRVRLQ